MEIRRVFDLLAYQEAKYPRPDAIAGKRGNEWVKYSTRKCMEISDKVALGLLAADLQAGDKVAIISENRPEWNFVDFGIQKAGMVSVPMYPTITVEDFRYIFEHSESKLIFVSNQEIYQKAKAAAKLLPAGSIKAIYTFENVENAPHWETLLPEASKASMAQLLEIQEKIQPEDLFTIIYTSGTTGKPKGVMLSHQNVVSNVKSAISSLVLDYHHRALSFLPLCHIFERTVTAAYFMKGIQIYYAESMDTIGDNLKEIKPHVFTAVPRLLEKVYDKIVGKGHELSGISKQIFFWALQLGLNYDTQKDKGFLYNLQLSLANNLVFDKWREALGGNLKYVICGSAALNPKLTRVFWAACIPILEGYGMTETSPVITAGVPKKEDYCIGAVGPVIEGVEVKIADDGEILVKGPNVMLGYFKDPERTAETIDTEGWLHTGDIGEFVQGRYLKITDRKKEMFKTSGGKYIAPQKIENQLKSILMVEQAMVVGEGQKFPAALLVPNVDYLKGWCADKGIAVDNLEEIVSHPVVLEAVQAEVEEINEQLAQYEKIKKFKLLPVVWGIDSGELTPTLKLKRKNIMERHREALAEIFELKGSLYE